MTVQGSRFLHSIAAFKAGLAAERALASSAF